MANDGWEFWRVSPVSRGGGPEWLAMTRPGARAAIDRRKMWTLIPNRVIFLANWYLTEDYWREDEANAWAYENLNIEEARDVALEMPAVSTEEIARLTHPESCLTLDQIDRYTVDKILGKRTTSSLSGRS
jgi:hypothetical protein